MRRIILLVAAMALLLAIPTAASGHGSPSKPKCFKVKVYKHYKGDEGHKKFKVICPKPKAPAPNPTPAPAPPVADPDRTGYCVKEPVIRQADGSLGHYVDVLPDSYATDPTYAGAVPAFFVVGIGSMCGPQPPGYVPTGRLVLNNGEVSATAEDNIHPEFVRG